MIQFYNPFHWIKRPFKSSLLQKYRNAWRIFGGHIYLKDLMSDSPYGTNLQPGLFDYLTLFSHYPLAKLRYDNPYKIIKGIANIILGLHLGLRLLFVGLGLLISTPVILMMQAAFSLKVSKQEKLNIYLLESCKRNVIGQINENKMQRLVIDQQADIHAKNSKGNTVLDILIKKFDKLLYNYSEQLISPKHVSTQFKTILSPIQSIIDLEGSCNTENKNKLLYYTLRLFHTQPIKGNETIAKNIIEKLVKSMIKSGEKILDEECYKNLSTTGRHEFLKIISMQIKTEENPNNKVLLQQLFQQQCNALSLNKKVEQDILISLFNTAADSLNYAVISYFINRFQEERYIPINNHRKHYDFLKKLLYLSQNNFFIKSEEDKILNAFKYQLPTLFLSNHNYSIEEHPFYKLFNNIIFDLNDEKRIRILSIFINQLKNPNVSLYFRKECSEKMKSHLEMAIKSLEEESTKSTKTIDYHALERIERIKRMLDFAGLSDESQKKLVTFMTASRITRNYKSLGIWFPKGVENIMTKYLTEGLDEPKKIRF